MKRSPSLTVILTLALMVLLTPYNSKAYRLAGGLCVGKATGSITGNLTGTITSLEAYPTSGLPCLELGLGADANFSAPSVPIGYRFTLWPGVWRATDDLSETDVWANSLDAIAYMPLSFFYFPFLKRVGLGAKLLNLKVTHDVTGDTSDEKIGMNAYYYYPMLYLRLELLQWNIITLGGEGLGFYKDNYNRFYDWKGFLDISVSESTQVAAGYRYQDYKIRGEDFTTDSAFHGPYLLLNMLF
jgi:hypothetical protein